MHIRLIALCWLFPLTAAAQPFISSYEKNDLDKCILQCDKEIDKGGDKQLAYLFKAKAFHRKYVQDQNCLTCLSRSMGGLEMMAIKDQSGSFREKYQQDIDTIFLDLRAEVLDAVHSGPAWLLKDLLPRMEKFTDHYFEKYLRGLEAELDDDIYQATKWFNEAARQLYLEWKDGQQPDTVSLAVFRSLGEGLLDFNDHRSAITIWQRALLMYPEELVYPAYSSFLVTTSFNAWIVQQDSLSELFLDAFDSLALQFPARDVDTLILRYLLFSDEYRDTPVHYLSNLVCDRYPALSAEVCDSLISDWARSVSFSVVRGRLRADWDRKPVNDLINLSSCEGYDERKVHDPGVIFHHLVDMDPVRAAQWYHCLTEEGVELSDWDADLAQLTEQLNGLLSDAFSQELYAARLALPADNEGALELLDISLNEIRDQIDSGDFSAAGAWLRGEINRNPDSEQLRSLYKYWVTRDYLANLKEPLDRRSHDQWKGDASRCDAGVLPEQAYADFLQAMNYLRRLAGVPDSVILLPEWNAKCQQAALMMHAEGRLSHRPNSSWNCYSEEGQYAAGMSNLSLGYGGIPSLLGQVYDSGSNNGSVGHRRWVLTPYRKVYGMGSTNDAMALWTLGGKQANFDRSVTEGYTERFVAWPSEWYFPADLIPYRWSFSLAYADFSETTVRVFHGKKELSLTVLPLEQGYGQNTIVWEVSNRPPLDYIEQTFRVEISGVKQSGETRNYSYEVISLPIVE